MRELSGVSSDNYLVRSGICELEDERLSQCTWVEHTMVAQNLVLKGNTDQIREYTT